MQKTWLTEYSLNNSVKQCFEQTAILHQEESEFQEIKVVETSSLGRVLLLDDFAMISQKDEFIYHEVMAHIPTLCQSNTKNVLVLGAGDGGVVRELVRYQSIENITLVEIDSKVTEVCQKFFPEVSSGLNDPRVSIIFEDALKYVTNLKPGSFDLIICDSTDPEGIAAGLYQKDFYQKALELLTDEGIFMCQTETPFFDEFDIKSIYRNLGQIFPVVAPVCAPILIYPGVFWTFAFCSKKWTISDIKEHKRSEYNVFATELKWHNPNWQLASTHLPNYVKEMLFD